MQGSGIGVSDFKMLRVKGNYFIDIARKSR